MYKKLAQLFAAVILIFSLLTSCNNPDGKTYPTDPEPGHWDHGVQTFTEFVIIKPTWGQAFYYAFKDGYTWQFIAGLILIVAAGGMFYSLTKKYLTVNLVNIFLTFLLVAGGLAFIYARPGTIKWDNSVKIEKQRYEAAKDNLPAFWDQLYSEKRIVGTSGE